MKENELKGSHNLYDAKECLKIKLGENVETSRIVKKLYEQFEKTIINYTFENLQILLNILHSETLKLALLEFGKEIPQPLIMLIANLREDAA